MRLDHPLIRNDHHCPLCRGYKTPGNVTCWSCYREHDLRRRNAQADTIIDAREAALTEEARS
jgi:hypothetical protein